MAVSAWSGIRKAEMRILLRIEFDGRDFHGWQIQPGVPTVQDSIEKAVAELCGRHVPVTGAGRTDAGVHAVDLPVHLDIKPEELERIINGLNTRLPSSISCWSVKEVADDFNARFNAISRSYCYRIARHRHPLTRITEYQPRNPELNTDIMQRAARLSLGKNSWKGFSKEGSGNATWDMNVMETSVAEDLLGWNLRITANRFLRGVVRIWAGTLFRIGTGRIEPELIQQILMEENRDKAGPSLPACGLTLMDVNYPYEVQQK